MTLTEYAARRGVTKWAVSKAVQAGRLARSVGRDAQGRPTIVDPVLADQEWEASTRKRSYFPPAGRQDAAPSAESRPDSSALAPELVRAAGPAASGLPAGVPTYNVSQAVRAQAAARREAALAEMAELELAAQRGQLVDAQQAKADVFARISMAKTRLLGVPTLVAQDCPDIAARVVPLIDKRIRDALEELSGP